MKLIVKFNLSFAAMFVVGLLVAGWASNRQLQANAREEILQQARFMMFSASAMRNYTGTQIKPLLEAEMHARFLPQSVPAYAATEVINDLRTQYPEYAYKEATLNPTNPRDRATDWEADVVNQFRQDPSKQELVGERETPGGTALYLAHPIQINDTACLVCHSTAAAAPKTLVDKYGSANGFGWQAHEIVGAQVVSVPSEVSLRRARNTFQAFMLSLTGVFAFIFVVLNLMIYRIVIQPVTQLSKHADEVSLGNLEATPFIAESQDEIGGLASSFDRMRKSLIKAIQMLGE